MRLETSLLLRVWTWQLQLKVNIRHTFKWGLIREMFLTSQCRILYFHVSYVRACARNIQSYCNITCLILCNLYCLTNCSYMEFTYVVDSVVLRSIIAKLFCDSYSQKQLISWGIRRSVFIFLYRKKGLAGSVRSQMIQGVP